MTFEDYCRRKTEAARLASIPGFQSVVAPGTAPPGLVPIGNAWSRAKFDGDFYRSKEDGRRALPAVSLVFVQSADRNTGADDPFRLGGGETDKHLVYEGLSRVDADGVLAGASTAAGDETVFSIWHPELVRLRAELGRPRHPAQVIVTGSGHVPIESALLYNERSLRVVVITTPSGVAALTGPLKARPWIEVIEAGPSLEVALAMRALHARGIRVVSAVGGRRTARALLGANVVADLYLTTSPLRGGEPGTPLSEEPLPRHVRLLEKSGRGREGGVRFEHRVFNR